MVSLPYMQGHCYLYGFLALYARSLLFIWFPFICKVNVIHG